MSKKMIDSRFKTGANDGLAIEDIYEVTENKARNRAVEAVAEISVLAGKTVKPFEALEDIEIEVPEPPEIPEIIEEILDLLAKLVEGKIKLGLPGNLGSIPLTPELLSGLVFGDFEMEWDYGAQQLLLGISGTASASKKQDIASQAENIIASLSNRAEEKERQENPPEFPLPVEPEKPLDVDIDHPLVDAVVYGEVCEGLGSMGSTAALGDLLDLIDNDNVKTYAGLKAIRGGANPDGNNSFVNAVSPPGEVDLSQPVGGGGNVTREPEGATVDPGIGQYASMRPEDNRSGRIVPDSSPIRTVGGVGQGSYLDPATVAQLTSTELNAALIGALRDKATSNVTEDPLPADAPLPPGGLNGSVVAGVSGVPSDGRSPIGRDRVPDNVNTLTRPPLVPERTVVGSPVAPRRSSVPGDLDGMRSDLVGLRTHYPDNEPTGNRVDIDVIESVLDRVSPAYIRRQYPKLIRWILQGYRRRKDVTVDEGYAQLNRVLEKLDPDWKHFQHGERTLSKAWLMRFASSDAKKLFILHPGSDWLNEAVIARDYGERHPYTSIKEQYPMIAL